MVLDREEEGILKVQMENDLLEYWNLLRAKDIRMFIRESCLLFLCKAKGLVRKWRIQFCGGASANEHCSRCYIVINKFLSEPFIPANQGMPDKPDSSTSTRPPMSQMSTTAPVSWPASSLAAVEPADTPTVSDTGHVNVQAQKKSAKTSPAKKRLKSDDGGCARTRGDSEQGTKNDRNLPKASDLIIMPGLECMVKATIQDPNFPDLVEAVHTIISNM
ncbi:uncharacterized protein LOC135205451 isoform X2 [Macrobrachium nipponense]|uniref:uncharacterized protein LOC135205451 isoform X2 n=1 Tax=Macrobrachium nipponense TaxID=159736 RepID=UPI0030C84366